MEQVIYEASNHQLSVIPGVWLILIIALISLYLKITWKTNSASGKICIFIVLSILIVGVTSFFVSYCSSQTVYKKYLNGEYYIVEGQISEYELGTDEKPSYPDRFSVKGIPFIVSDSPVSGFGYPLRKIDGGILKDGMRCKIYYIPHRFENIIMKLCVVD